MTGPNQPPVPSVTVSVPGSSSPQRAVSTRKKRQRERDKERRSQKRKQAHAVGDEGNDGAISSAGPSMSGSLAGSQPSSTSPSPWLVTLPSLPDSPTLSESVPLSPVKEQIPVVQHGTPPETQAACHLNPSQVREKARSSNKREHKRAVEKARDLLLFGCATYKAEEIRTWPAERVLEEASKLEEEILENNDGTVWLVNLDRRQQARTGDASHYEGKVPNLSDEKIESEGWTILTTGTIYGYRIIEKKKRLVFSA